MENYGKMYLHLFHSVSDALAELEKQNDGAAAELLKTARCHCEMLYIKEEEGT